MVNYIILGIIQGITEFLPISSSGHLVLAQKLLGVSENQVALSVVLHLGTLLSILVFFFKDILKVFKDRKLVLCLIVTTVITAAIGFAGKDFFEQLFSSTLYVGIALFVTGLILILTKRFTKGAKTILEVKDAAILGLTQSIAIIPGISRSGITISTLLFRSIDRAKSFQYSFLAAIPVIFGAALLEIKKIDTILDVQPSAVAVGFMVSFLSGLMSLGVLKWVMMRAKLHYFGYYCIVVSVITILFIK